MKLLSLAFLPELARDFRFGFRKLARNPGFTLLVVLVLALGIGANTMVFAIYNGVLLKSLPFENPRQVVSIRNRNLAEGFPRFPFFYPDYVTYRDETRSFSEVGAVTSFDFTLSDDTHSADAVNGSRISANGFKLIGQTPLLGRDFDPADSKPGAPPVVILSHAVWQLRYGGDPDILRKVVRVNGQPAAIVGIMRQGIQFPETSMLWLPLVPTAQDEQRQTAFDLFARLREGVSIDQAQAEMSGIAQRLSQEHPDTHKGVESDVRPYLDTAIDSSNRAILMTLMGSVTFVMMITCANAANLLLSRAVSRSHETAMQAALGAGRWRIVRQFLIESVLMGFMGGVLGLLLAYVGIRIFTRAVSYFGFPYWTSLSLDASVFAYLFALCFVTGIVFGIAPALHISRGNLNNVLNEGGRGASGGRRTRYLANALVVFEIALTVVLLVGGGLMIRSFLRMQLVDVGVKTENLLTVRIRLLNSKYPQPADSARFAERLVESIGALPGIENVAIASDIPANGAGRRPFKLADDAVPRPNQPPPTVPTLVVSDGYFQVLGLAVLRGRDFTTGDGAKGSEAVIVNERFANQYWPGQDPIGKRIQLNFAGRPWLTVIAIAPPILQTNPQQQAVDPAIYVPFLQQPLTTMSLIVKSHGSREATTNLLRQEIRRIDADIPMFDVLSIDDVLDRQNTVRSILSALFSTFAVIALVLSAVGIYAVTAHSVSQRTQEIGVRMAFGADRTSIVALVLRQGFRHLAFGLPPGLLAAVGLSRFLEDQLFQVSSTDPSTYLSISAFMIAVVIVACLVPANRASNVRCADALRAE